MNIRILRRASTGDSHSIFLEGRRGAKNATRMWNTRDDVERLRGRELFVAYSSYSSY